MLRKIHTILSLLLLAASVSAQEPAMSVAVRNAADTQALLHLYQNYCQHHECIKCEVGYAIFNDRQLKLF